jgi:hypothetical protein
MGESGTPPQDAQGASVWRAHLAEVLQAVAELHDTVQRETVENTRVRTTLEKDIERLTAAIENIEDTVCGKIGQNTGLATEFFLLRARVEHIEQSDKHTKQRNWGLALQIAPVLLTWAGLVVMWLVQRTP